MGVAGFIGEKFCKVVYCAHAGTGDGSSASNPKALESGDLFAIPAGTLITDVAVVVTTAVTGSTQIDIGDDDGATSFVSAATLTVNAVTLNDAAYLINSGQNLGKYYASAGKEVKIAVTGSSQAGAVAVVIQGVKIA